HSGIGGAEPAARFRTRAHKPNIAGWRVSGYLMRSNRLKGPAARMKSRQGKKRVGENPRDPELSREGFWNRNANARSLRNSAPRSTCSEQKGTSCGTLLFRPRDKRFPPGILPF